MFYLDINEKDNREGHITKVIMLLNNIICTRCIMMVKKVFIIFLACCFFSTAVSMNAFLYAQQNTNDIGSQKEQLEQFMQEYISSEANELFEQILACKKGEIDLTEKEIKDIAFQNIEKISSEAKIGINQSSACTDIFENFIYSSISFGITRGIFPPGAIVRRLLFGYLNCLSKEGKLRIPENPLCNVLLISALGSSDWATWSVFFTLHYSICVLELF
jgi:hypothetical protein